MNRLPVNAIWIFGDQHRAQALSCNGDVNVQTPEIDRLAGEGVNFNRAVCGFPLCCPFRGSLLTSQYPHACVPGHEYPLPADMPTIAHAFGAHGYDTAYFGKWHLSGFHERDGRAAHHVVPRDRRGGFGTWIGYENNNSQWDAWVHGHTAAGEDVPLQRLPGYETDSLADHLIAFLKARGAPRKPDTARPFFAVLSVQPPHDPYLAPADFMRRHNPQSLVMRPNVPDIPRIQEQARRELAGACAQIENLDWNVGRIRQALAETGLDRDTVILFFSDHGDMHGSHGQFRKMSPWEESIRVPFIVGGPPTCYGHGGGRVGHVLNHVDIAPTTLGLCGLDAPAWMKGHDYAYVYRRERKRTMPPDSAFLQSVIPTRHGHSVDRPWRGVVTESGWKYIAFDRAPWLMFNLNEDPFERVNLAHNTIFGDQRAALHARLAQWILETHDSFVLPDLD